MAGVYKNRELLRLRSVRRSSARLPACAMTELNVSSMAGGDRQTVPRHAQGRRESSAQWHSAARHSTSLPQRHGRSDCHSSPTARSTAPASSQHRLITSNHSPAPFSSPHSLPSDRRSAQMAEALQQRVQAAEEQAASNPAAAVAALREVVVTGSGSNDAESLKIREAALQKLADLLVKQRDAAALRGLLTDLRPLFAAIPKAKTAKIVRTVIDSIARVPDSTLLLVRRGQGALHCNAGDGGCGWAAAVVRAAVAPLVALQVQQQAASTSSWPPCLSPAAEGGVPGAGGVGDGGEAHIFAPAHRDPPGAAAHGPEGLPRRPAAHRWV